MKTDTLAIITAIVGFSVIVVMAITPVGGWHPSNPHASMYKAAMAVACCSTFAMIIVMLIVNAFKTK